MKHKLLILIFAMFLLVLPSSFGALELFERYNDNSTGDELRPCRNDLWTGMTFTQGNTSTKKNINISKIALWFANEGSPVSMDICVYSTENGAPKNKLGCNYTVAEDTPFTTTDDKFEKFNISFNPVVEINSSNGNDFFAIVCNGTDSGAPAQFGIFADATSPTYVGGNMWQGVNPPTSNITTKDVLFEIWAENGSASSDTTLPIVNTSFNISTFYINSVINFSGNITDETGLSTANITHNMSGILTKLNFTLIGTSASNVSNTTRISTGRGSVINFTMYATDTSNNVRQNSTLITIADTLGSIFIGINNTSPKINEVINISGNTTDDDNDFAFGIISYNISGNPQLNFSFILSGTKGNFSQNITINLTRGNVINFTVFYNDTVGTRTQNSTLITVSNTAPNGTNFVNTTGKHYSRNVSINWTPASDSDSDALRYIVYWDLDITPTALYYNGTDLNISTNWTSDNTYFYQIKAMDDISESALSPVFNLTLDTGIPVLTINISNNTFTRFNQTINISIDDSFPYNLTMRIYLGENNYYSITNSTTKNRLIDLIAIINLTEDGNYTIEINASDSDKTSPKIDGILKNSFKKGEAEYVMNDTLNGINYKMLIRFEDKNENELTTPSDYKGYAVYNDKGTHINFGLNVTSNRNGFIPVYDIQTQNINIDILNDSIKGHLVWHPYGVDFEGKLLVNGIERNYTVNIKRLTSTRIKVSIIPATDINNNDIVQFRSESIFGLNTLDIFRTLVIDKTAPVFTSASNRTADSSNSTTITTATNVNISIFGLGDIYLDRGNFSHNASGSWTNQSISIIGNSTYHYIIGSGNFSVGQVVGWKFYVFDIAGNALDPIYTFTVGSPVASPKSSGTGSTSSVTIPQSLLNPFGIEPINETCPVKQQLLDGRCYPCNPEIGYLQFNPNDRSVQCVECTEGFKLINKNCVLKEPEPIKNRINMYIDKWATSISEKVFKTSNPLAGFVVLVSAGLGAYYGVSYLRRKW